MADVSLSPTARKFKTGRYKHFKGGEYKVFGIALHTETNEEFVIYQHETEDNPTGWWARPLEMFLGDKEMPDGKKVKRFRFIRND